MQNASHKTSYSNILSYALQPRSPVRLLCPAEFQRSFRQVYGAPCARSFRPALPRAWSRSKADSWRLDSQHPWIEATLRRQKAGGEWKASYHANIDHGAETSHSCRVGGEAEELHIGPGFDEKQLTKAVEALGFLVQQGSQVDTSVFYNILKGCIAQRHLVLGSRVHELAVKAGYETNSFLANHIIRMYSGHGRLKEAMQVFSVAEPTCYIWASIIFAHTRHGQPMKGINLYRQMRASTVKPNNHIFVAVLKACAMAEDLCSGREVHSDILRAECEPNEFVGSCLVDMYAKCGSLEDARRAFDKLRAKDVVTWNAIIAGYAQHGLGREALDLWTDMQHHGIILADKVTFICLLQACASIGNLHYGKQLHAQIKDRGLEADEVIGSCIVNMYAKCGSFPDACRVFGSLSSKNLLTWTVMIAGYAQHGIGEEALSLYARMQQEGMNIPNHVTFVSLLQACASVGALQQGKQIHVQICEQKLEADVVIGTCLVDMYAKCNSLEDARGVFDNLPTRDVVTWNAMIAGYAQHGFGHEALALYASMQQEAIFTANVATFVSLLQACGSIAGLEIGKEIHAKIVLEATEICLANPLIDMYGKCGSMTDAQQVFDGLPTRDTVTWNALVAGYARQGEFQLVFDLFDRMRQESVQPDGITFLSALTVCSHVGLVDQGLEYFEAMTRQCGITPTIEHYVCMIDLFGRAGQVDKAMEIVTMMPSHSHGELWRTVLGACRKWNLVEIARKAFEFAMAVDKNDFAACVLMTNIYAAANMWEEVEEIQRMKVKAQVWKKPGKSWWTNIDGTVYTFLVGDVGHLEGYRIFAELACYSAKMNEEEDLSHCEPALQAHLMRERWSARRTRWELING